jgi:hypothetical protein
MIDDIAHALYRTYIGDVEPINARPLNTHLCITLSRKRQHPSLTNLDTLLSMLDRKDQLMV